MKTHTKRLLSLLLALCLLLTAAPLAGFENLDLLPKAQAKTYKTGDIITFGGYPQSRVTDSATLAALNGITKNWISYKYYSGTGDWENGQMQPGDWMRYADFSNNGAKYRAVTFDSYRPLLTGGISSADISKEFFIRYEQDINGYTPNNVYYFKYESMQWRVLDPNAGLVLCENIIDSQAYQNTIYCNSSQGGYFQGENSSVYANDYASSSIRNWLINDFYNTAFSSSEQSLIAETKLDNSSRYDSKSKYNRASTTDKIFLLSFNDMLNTAYGFSSSNDDYDVARRAAGTDYAKCQGVCTSDHYTAADGKATSSWWLRSPGAASSIGAEINVCGAIDDGNHIGIDVGYTYEGVRPAFKFKSGIIESSNPNGGSGASGTETDTKTDFTVRFDPNGGTGAPEARKVAKGATVTLSDITPTRSGYSFDGWYTAASGGEMFTSSTPVIKDITLYAHWKITTHFPNGYEFLEDSYSFINDLSTDINQKYFDGIFESGTASLAHKEYHYADGGLCYGMAFTTASIYNGYPGISNWAFRKNLWSSDLATKIRDLKRDTWWGKQSAAYIDGAFDDCLTLLDFIKYAFIYQYSIEAERKLNNSSNNALDLLALVKQRTDAGQMGTAVGFSPYNGHNNAPRGHEVLAIGYEGNDILIDNPNNSGKWERMTVHEDGSWEFGGYNNNDHWLDWDTSTNRPYEILRTGNRVVASVSASTTNSRNKTDTAADNAATEEYYVLGTNKLNPEYNLVSISASEFNIKNTDYITLPSESKAGGQSETNNTLLWVKEGELVVDGLDEKTNTVVCAGDDKVITTESEAGSTVSINVQKATATIETGKNRNADISFKTVIEGDTNDTEVCVKTEGIATSDEVSASMTEKGVVVNGISEGTVSLIINDKVVSEKDFKDSDAKFEVAYDNSGETNTLSISADGAMPSDDPSYIPGDVSGDGEVTAEDARLALRAAVGLENYAVGSPEFLAADATKDGAITAEDARLILRAAVGLESLS